jgi:Zn-dependent M28 family amino/carboxypeptidase
MKRTTRQAAAVGAATAALLTTLVAPAPADNGTNSSALRTGVTAAGIKTHLTAFQSFATANNNQRSAGTIGHTASAEYVEAKLIAAGYNVSRQYFTYPKWDQTAESVLSAGSLALVDGTDFAAMDYSGSGSATGAVVVVDVVEPSVGGSTSGCEAADFAGFPAGAIALVQRGSCAFADKALNAQAAGASAVVIYNEGNEPGRSDLLFGTLGEPGVTVPVVGTSYATGRDLATQATATVAVTGVITNTSTYNVLADTKSGRSDRLVVAGGHLDSVPDGPGINDNGSGTATLLEVALQMADQRIKPRNMVRFAFWSGEEDGLIGSEYYVAQLSKTQIRQHMANLNFDMIGSPNYGRFIYDGDGSAAADPSEGAGPNGSDVIEAIFTSYFDGRGLTSAPTAFDGRSDYGPFIEVGIPAGGLFTGAEDVKTADEAALFGGTAGEAFDKCYHSLCDDITNINITALDEMSDAVAHAVLSLAMSTSAINGASKGNGAGTSDFEYKGSHAQR